MDWKTELQSLGVWWVGWSLLDYAKPFAVAAAVSFFAWLISRYRQSSWQREFRGAFVATTIVTLGLLIMSVIGRFGNPLERPLAADDARVEIVGIDTPSFDSRGLFCMNFRIANHGKAVAQIGDTQGVVGYSYGPQPQLLRRSELDARFRFLLAIGFPPNDEFTNEIQPEKDSLTAVTACMEPPKAPSNADNMYNLTRIAWRDIVMAEDEIGVTEICGYYVGDPKSSPFRACPSHNRIYILKRPPDINGNSN